jgi:CBS domain-containing protein
LGAPHFGAAAYKWRADERASAAGVKSACDGYENQHTIKEENMGGQKVREVMTDRPRCVSPETPISDAARLMRSEDVGLLPILEGEKVTGVVTDRDIVIQAVAEEKDPRGMPVREVASRELVTIGPDEDLSEALRLMASYQVRRLPVVDEDSRLVGVLSQADVAREAKEKDVGQMVEEISQTPTGPRV